MGLGGTDMSWSGRGCIWLYLLILASLPTHDFKYLEWKIWILNKMSFSKELFSWLMMCYIDFYNLESNNQYRSLSYLCTYKNLTKLIWSPRGIFILWRLVKNLANKVKPIQRCEFEKYQTLKHTMSSLNQVNFMLQFDFPGHLVSDKVL